MLRIFNALLCVLLVSPNISYLYALDSIDVSNQAHAQWPNVTEHRARKLEGMGYEALDAANKGDVLKLHTLLYMIKNEVELMMGAKVRIEEFVDDAFKQAEAQGKKFSENDKISMKRTLGISCKGIPEYDYEISIEDGVSVINKMRGSAYIEQQYYKPPVALDTGISMIIIGGLIAVIPIPFCTAAGGWMITTGLGLIVCECVQGCERQGGRQDNYMDIRQDRYRGR